MAMTAFAPAITRSREIIATKTAEVALKLVPDVSEQTQENRKYFAKFVSVVGVLAEGWVPYGRRECSWILALPAQYSSLHIIIVRCERKNQMYGF